MDLFMVLEMLPSIFLFPVCNLCSLLLPQVKLCLIFITQPFHLQFHTILALCFPGTQYFEEELQKNYDCIRQVYKNNRVPSKIKLLKNAKQFLFQEKAFISMFLDVKRKC